MDSNTFGGNDTSTEGKPFKWHAIYLTYAIVMFLVLTVGFLGNVLTLVILRYPEHRRKVIAPLMINLAVADILLIVLVYPVIGVTNLLGWRLKEGSIRCLWSSFANGAAGIASIATLATMSGSMYYVIRQTRLHPKIHTGCMTLLVIGTWLYGILLNLPPVIGWTKAVPAAFLTSWLPYCIVSIAALVNGRHVLSSGEAEIPELMAKASVIYNPIVYAVMSGAYRTSLRKMITGKNDPRVTPNIMISTAVMSSYFNSVAINVTQEETAV
ncbi:hypothetical protein ACROYT_G011561 [Oculina patagonica]